jgi:ABC-type transporter Mla MlaB component
MDRKASIHRCALDGDLTVRSAARIQGQLVDLLDRHRAIELDCAGATDIDLSFVQLVLAARKSADAIGASLTLSHPAGAVLHDAVTRAGILTCDAERAFWLNTTGETRDGQDHPHRG